MSNKSNPDCRIKLRQSDLKFILDVQQAFDTKSIPEALHLVLNWARVSMLLSKTASPPEPLKETDPEEIEKMKAEMQQTIFG